jgi:hypothetical protein
MQPARQLSLKANSMAKYRPLACGPVAVAKVNEA